VEKDSRSHSGAPPLPGRNHKHETVGAVDEPVGKRDKKLEKLDLLDEIARLLRESSEEKEAETEEVEEDIIRKFGATVKDRDAYNILLKKGPMSAEQLALEMKVSRSTASARLNRLFNLGLVDKEARGKEIFYRAKKRVEK